MTDSNEHLELTEAFDLSALPASFYNDPYPYYRSLAAGPAVYQAPSGGYYLTRYTDVRAVYRDASRFSSDKSLQFAPVFGPDSPLYQHHTTSMVFNDPPLHTDVRRAIGNALSEKMLDAMRTGLEALVVRLLDDLSAKTNVDLITDYASAIPVEIIGNLLRIPQADRGPLRAWSLAILAALEVGLSKTQIQVGNRAVEEFVSYLEHLLKSRQDQLSDDEDDIVARLLTWQHEGRKLSAHELYHQLVFLLNAGHETTTNLIGNGIELMLRHERARERLLEQPTLIKTTVEEMLRFESPNQLGNRTTTEEVVLYGVTLPQGSVVTLFIGAANRDPEFFSDPGTFEISRQDNPHLSFAAGIHRCAGLHVARLEAQIAIFEFLQRFPNARLIQPPQRAHRARFRGFTTLHAQLV